MSRLAKLFGLILLLSAVGCRTPKNITYFQNFKDDTLFTVNSKGAEIKLNSGDKVSIIVSCRDADVSRMFNLLTVTQNFGSTNTNRISYYTVDDEGNIDFPIVGKIPVSGLNRNEVCDIVKQKLISSELIKDPVVTVEFVNMHFDILGEVARPGRYTIDHDRITLLDALGMAGDMSILGKRCNLKVVRTEGDNTKVYTIDMTDGDSILNSPAFYLRQNDVVYVEANNFRKRQSIASGNTAYSPSFWISVASFCMSVYVIFIR